MSKKNNLYCHVCLSRVIPIGRNKIHCNGGCDWNDCDISFMKEFNFAIDYEHMLSLREFRK